MGNTSKSKAIERLKKALGEIPTLKQQHRFGPEFTKWERNTRVAVANTFGENSNHLKDFTNINYLPRALWGGMEDSFLQSVYIKGLESASSILQSMIDEIEEYWDDNGQEPEKPSPKRDPQQADKIFIIHGRDDGTKETVARFVKTLCLTPVILHEQSNQGRTIIEKFEEYAQVGFAIALLTPDDVGALKEQKKSLKPRARQNVIFEFGFFIGLLGRKRVFALTKGDVELPSDYSGVIYIPIDESGAWKMMLVKELKAAGLPVDANLVY